MADYFVQTGGALISPLETLWRSADLVVILFQALIVILIGYIVGWAFGFITHKLLDKARVDQQLKKAGLAHSIGFLSISTLLGGIVKWLIFALFLEEAARLLGVLQFANLLAQLAGWVPSLVAAIIIMLVGLVLADFAADRLLHAKRKGVKVVSGIVRWFIILFVALIALEQLGIRVDLATNATLLLVAGISAGLAIAIGIGFGKALQPEAAKMIKKIKRDL